jgi:hypothetical protein
MIENRVKPIRYLVIVLLIVLSFLYVVNYRNDGYPILVGILFCLISFGVLSVKEYQDDLIGMKGDTLINIVYGLLFGGIFFLVTKFIPFLDLAYPTYAYSVGESLKFFLIVIVSPLTESIFFQCAIFAFFSNFDRKKKNLWAWIILASFLFSIFHLGAYILGFYTLSGDEALTSIGSNITAFFSAFLFSALAMLFALRKGINKANIAFIITFHLVMNFINYLMANATFAIG